MPRRMSGRFLEVVMKGEKQEMNRAGTSLTIKKRFSAKRLALMGVFVALSYVVSFIEIPLPFFGAEFLKLDFGNVFIALIAFLLGPVEGVVVCFLKEALRCIGSSSLCAGELANFLITSSFILFPSILYQRRKNLETVIRAMDIACVIATAVALIANRLIIFPAYAYVFGGSIFGMTVKVAFAKFWVAILLFNIIKTMLVAWLTRLLYKRLSNFLKKIKI